MQRPRRSLCGLARRSAAAVALQWQPRGIFTNRKWNPGERGHLPSEPSTCVSYVAPEEQKIRRWLSAADISHEAADDDEDFNDTGGEASVAASVDWNALPSAHAIERQLPSCEQLNDELPTAEDIRRHLDCELMDASRHSARMLRHVLVCCDAFKGSASSAKIGAAVEEAICGATGRLWSSQQSCTPTPWIFTHCPMSDGGAGLLDTILGQTDAAGRCGAFERITIPPGTIVHPLIPDSLRGSETYLENCSFAYDPEHHVLLIETAQANGLPLVPDEHRDPAKTSSYGVGQLLKYAVEYALQRCRPDQCDGATVHEVHRMHDPGKCVGDKGKAALPLTCFVGIGGSSTNDAGVGALQALGLRVFLDRAGLRESGVPGRLEVVVADSAGADEVEWTRPVTGEVLHLLRRLEPTPDFLAFVRAFQPRVAQAALDVPCDREVGDGNGCVHEDGSARLSLICDVTNPLLGPEGATRIYGPQKGLKSSEAAELLEAGLARVVQCIAASGDLRCLVGSARGPAPDCLSACHVWRRWCDPPDDSEVAAQEPTYLCPGDVTDYLLSLPGGGAAGGIGCTFHGLLQASMQRGPDAVAALTSLASRLRAADIVVTGEGSFDAQTIAYSKTVGRILGLVHDEYERESLASPLGSPTSALPEPRPTVPLRRGKIRVLVVCGRTSFTSEEEVHQELRRCWGRGALGGAASGAQAPAVPLPAVRLLALLPRFTESEAMRDPAACLAQLLLERGGLEALFGDLGESETRCEGRPR